MRGRARKHTHAYTRTHAPTHTHPHPHARTHAPTHGSLIVSVTAIFIWLAGDDGDRSAVHPAPPRPTRAGPARAHAPRLLRSGEWGIGRGDAADPLPDTSAHLRLHQ